MKNKFLALAFVIIISAANQLSIASCGNLDCNCPPPCCCLSNWYIAASGSVAWHNDHKFIDTGVEEDIFFTSRSSRHYKVGGGAAASIGYIFNTCDYLNLRLEGEVVWRRNSLKNENFVDIENGVEIENVTERKTGYTQDLGLMANLIADLPLLCDLDFYFGAGLGVSFNQLKLDKKNNDELFAWQVLAGFAYKICPNIALTAGYRLFATDKVKTANIGLKCRDIPLTQSIDIGIRFRL